MPSFIVDLSTLPAESLLPVMQIAEQLRQQDVVRSWSSWGTSALMVDGDAAARDAIRALGVGVWNEPVAVKDVAEPFIRELLTAWNIGLSPSYQGERAAAAALDPASLLAPAGCTPGAIDANLSLGDVATGGVLGGRTEHGFAPSVARRDRRALVGTIGVVVLQIDGPPGSVAAFSLDEWASVMISLANGFDILTTLAPRNAHLVFVADVRRAQLMLDPGAVPVPGNATDPAADDYARIEATWRDPALAQLGAHSGREGFRDLARSGRWLFDPDWVLIVVVTKYRAAWPGYAPDYRDVVISYSMERELGALGRMPEIFAHEMCHTVGAMDEYGKCSMLQKGGFANLANLNCQNGNIFSVSCLMRDLSRSACPPTGGQVGWCDFTANGVLDPFDTDFVPFP
jgi:hypothetical protein